VVIGDVTDKGVPAALVMATCRSMLRAATQHSRTPSEVLSSVNDDLVAEIPPAMFVTCLYAIVDTDAGEIVFANAGHNLPYVRTSDGVVELRATGMPLGLMPGMEYNEHTHRLERGDVMVLTSDGITEAHSAEGEMYGFGRLMGRVAKKTKGDDLIASLVGDLERWVGPGAEQEDDITLVVVRRTASAQAAADVLDHHEREKRLVSFRLPSVEGNERIAIDTVSEAVSPLNLSHSRLERLKTAVGETVMNAIEHGNMNDPSLEVGVEVTTTPEELVVRVTDQGGDREIPVATEPDLEAKLDGLQTPRGWGLFLVSEMVDEVRRTMANGAHTVELVMSRKETANAG
jgi:anti-sigma regulatory factor (Ser/Thr protein kinase)